jgi:hypothetical protein
MALKTELIGVRMSRPEKEALAVICQREAASPSEFVRTLIRDELRRSGLWPVPAAQPCVKNAQPR